MKRLTPAVAVLAFSVCLSGCLAVAAAGVAAGVVYVTGDDSSEVTFEASEDRVFDACIAEIEDRGKVSVQDREGGKIVGYIEKSKVEIVLTRPTKSTVKVDIEARKNEGVSPDSDTAEAVARGLVRRLG